MALVTTFATTPLTLALFPSWYQKKLAAWKRGEIEWDGSRLAPEAFPGEDGDAALEKGQGSEIRRLLVCLRLDSLPEIFTFISLLGGDKAAVAAPKTHPTRNGKTRQGDLDPSMALSKRPLEVHGVRMLELSDRLSSVMKETESDELSSRDPVVNAFHTFGQLNSVAVSGEVQLVPEGSYSSILNERAADRRSDMILLPWSETGNLSEAIMTTAPEPTPNALGNGTYNQFVSTFLDSAPCNAAIFVNNGFGAAPREPMRSLVRSLTSVSLRSANIAPVTAPVLDRSHHIVFPYVGGDDDRVALRFVLRLAKNPNVTATILQLKVSSSALGTAESSTTKDGSSVGTAVLHPSNEEDRIFFASMADSLAGELQSRVLFDTVDTLEPVQDALGYVKAEVGLSPKNAGDLVVVGRRNEGIFHAHTAQSSQGQEGELRSSLGVLAERIILGNVKASVLVVQAGKKDV